MHSKMVWYPLQCVVRSENAPRAMIHYLIDCYGSVLQLQDFDGMTPLHNDFLKQFAGVILLLLEKHIPIINSGLKSLP